MAMQKFKMYLTVGIGTYTRGAVSLSDCRPGEESAKDEKFGRVVVKEFDLDVDVPSFDARQAELEALEAGVQKEKADSQHRVNILLDRISKLKAIGHEA